MAEENLFTPRCIRTNSGRYVNVFEPKAEMFCIEDIAHALSKEERFGNHLDDDYKVGQHVIHVVELLEPAHKWGGANHENGEPYLRDLGSPIKREIPQYVAIENGINTFLAPVFGYEFPFSKEIHEADRKMLLFEWDVFMLHRPPSDPSTVPPSQKSYFEKHGKYYVMTKQEVKKEFLRMYNELKAIQQKNGRK